MLPTKRNKIMANHGYSLRKCGRNYQELTTVKIPKARKMSSKDDKLYPIEVVEVDGSRARIHYVGYGNRYDEWRDLSELVTTSVNQRSHGDDTISRDVIVHDRQIQPYNLYNELRIKIKQSLVSRAGKTSPSVKIDMGFDYLLFKGGLQALGIAKQSIHGNIKYKLRQYEDLDPLLGKNWHYRGKIEVVIIPLLS